MPSVNATVIQPTLTFAARAGSDLSTSAPAVIAAVDILAYANSAGADASTYITIERISIPEPVSGGADSATTTSGAVGS